MDILYHNYTDYQDDICYSYGEPSADPRGGSADELPIQAIEAAYKAAYNRQRVARSVYEDWQAFRSLGAEWRLIEIAIEASEEVARPSWAYARKILSNCLAEGVYNEAQYNERQARFRARKIAAAIKVAKPMIMRSEPVQDDDFAAEAYAIMNRSRA